MRGFSGRAPDDVFLDKSGGGYHGTTASPCAPRAPDPLGLGLYGDGAHGGMRRGERRTEVDAWRELGGLDWDGC